ncbi:TRAP transporter substrate-binding protein [Thermodesulfobacteriota bacterium]
MKTILRIISLVMVLSFFISVSPVFAETKLLFNCFIPRAHRVFSHIWQPWAMNIEKASQGRVKVEFSAAPLGPVPRHLDMIKKGIADVTFDQHNFNPKLFVLPTIASMPFAGLSSEAASVALWRTHEKFFQKANEHEGVKLLGFMVIGPSHLLTTKKEVKTIADAKNLKIRISTRYAKEICDALGVVMVSVPGPASYEIISKGTVDGTTFSFSDIYNFRISKFLKNAFVIPGGLYAASFSAIMNQKKWDSLSKADQDAIQSVSGEPLARLTRSWDEGDKAAYERMKKEGVKINFMSQAEKNQMQKQFAGIMEQWKVEAKKRGVDAEAAVAYHRKVLEEVAATSWKPTP